MAIVIAVIIATITVVIIMFAVVELMIMVFIVRMVGKEYLSSMAKQSAWAESFIYLLLVYGSKFQIKAFFCVKKRTLTATRALIKRVQH